MFISMNMCIMLTIILRKKIRIGQENFKLCISNKPWKLKVTSLVLSEQPSKTKKYLQFYKTEKNHQNLKFLLDILLKLVIDYHSCCQFIFSSPSPNQLRCKHYNSWLRYHYSKHSLQEILLKPITDRVSANVSYIAHKARQYDFEQKRCYPTVRELGSLQTLIYTEGYSL